MKEIEKLYVYYDEEGDFLEIGLGDPKEGYSKDIKKGISERIDEKTGDIIGIEILAFRKRMTKLKEFNLSLSKKPEDAQNIKNKERLHIYYDEEGDFLEILIGSPQKGYGEEIRDGIFKIVNEKTKEVIGISIYRFKERTRNLNDIEIDLRPKIKLPS